VLLCVDSFEFGVCSWIDDMSDEFYVRYYVGHKGVFGHEYLEFEIRPNGKLRYANNTHYKNEALIQKDLFLNSLLLDEVKKMVTESEIMKQDDTNWPEPNKDGKQEMEIVMNNEHISFCTSKIASLVDIESSKDPDGLRAFYFLAQDLRGLVLSLIALHFKINPLGQ